MFHSEQKVETRSKENDKSTENFLSNVALSCTTIFMVVTVYIYVQDLMAVHKNLTQKLRYTKKITLSLYRYVCM